MSKFLLTFLFLICSYCAYSQIYFKNNTGEPVNVTLAQSLDVGSCKGCWTTEGWYRVLPGEKKEISGSLGWNSNVYYYAMTNSGKEYKGNYNFLVHPTGKHYIMNADMEYVKGEHSDYEWRGFRHVVTSKNPLEAFRLKYTIELDY